MGNWLKKLCKFKHKLRDNAQREDLEDIYGRDPHAGTHREKDRMLEDTKTHINVNVNLYSSFDLVNKTNELNVPQIKVIQNKSSEMHQDETLNLQGS